MHVAYPPVCSADIIGRPSVCPFLYVRNMDGTGRGAPRA
jgi:hypothetical protein